MIVLVVSKPQGLAMLKAIHKVLEEHVIVITCDDKHDYGRTCFEDILNYCKSNDLDIHVLTGGGLNQFLVDHKPKLCFVSGWYWLIDEQALNAIDKGCFGIHNSLLPSYRGGAPLVWSIINGDPFVGASVFLMTKGMDEGSILHQWKIDMEPHWDISDVLSSLEDLIIKDIGSIVLRYLNGDILLCAQSDEGVSYCPQRKESDSEVNWRMTGDTLFNYSRALQPPYPRLYFVKKNIKYQIYRLHKAPFCCHGKSGKALAYIESGLVVKCGGDISDGIIISDLRNTDNPEENLIDFRHFKIGEILN